LILFFLCLGSFKGLLVVISFVQVTNTWKILATFLNWVCFGLVIDCFIYVCLLYTICLPIFELRGKLVCTRFGDNP
jgi:hypothetical protein